MQVQFSMAVFSPAFGTSSMEKSEALPDNRVYLTQVGARKHKAILHREIRIIWFFNRLLYLNLTEADPDFFNRDIADGGAKESMKH